MDHNEYNTDLEKFTTIEEYSSRIIADMSGKIRSAIETMRLQLNELNIASNGRNRMKFEK